MFSSKPKTPAAPGAAPTVGGRRRSRRFRKGSKSKTRRGRKDFVTHKGSKSYNRRGHRQSRNAKGRKGRPYSRRSRSARRSRSGGVGFLA